MVPVGSSVMLKLVSSCTQLSRDCIPCTIIPLVHIDGNVPLSNILLNTISKRPVNKSALSIKYSFNNESGPNALLRFNFLILFKISERVIGMSVPEMWVLLVDFYQNFPNIRRFPNAQSGLFLMRDS